MAQGVTQPTPNGGDIMYEDDTHGDASLDAIAASFSPEDLYQKSQANVWKATDGTTAAAEKWGGAVFGLLPEYWFHVSIQNGDGSDDVALGRTTTFKASRCAIRFDAGKGMKVSSVGIANRFTQLGSLQQSGSASPLGYDGCEITLGATTTYDGNSKIYGTKFRLFGANVQLNIRRTSTSSDGDAVNIDVENFGTGNSPIQFGTSSIPLARVHHGYFKSLGSVTGTVAAFNVLDADDIHTGGISNNAIGVLAAYTLIRNGVAHGTPALADIRGSSGGTDLVDYTWSNAAAQQTSSATTNDWRSYSPSCVESVNGSPLSGVSLTVQDGSLATIIGPITSDANGQFSYTTPGITGIAIANAIKARVRATSWVEQGPFIATFTKNGYATEVVKWTWPRLTGSFGDQLVEVLGIVKMRLLTTGPTASFQVAPGGGVPGVPVAFADRSIPGDAAIDTWAWTFGDGGTSASQNPSHTYAAAGFYDVSLTVTTIIGSSTSTVVGAVYVSTPPPSRAPSALAVAVPTSGPAPLTVQFADTSDPGDASIATWLWDFGDGETGVVVFGGEPIPANMSDQQNPQHTYTAPGIYTVSLTVTTSIGQSTKTYVGLIRVGVQNVPMSGVAALSPFVAARLREQTGLNF